MRIELYLNGLAVDLPPDVELQLTFRVNDIRNPGSREAAFSETFTLPFTNRNDFITGNIRQANSYSDFPYLVVPCKIVVDGNPLLKGTASLTELQDGYSVSITGENADIFEIVKEKPLSAIDLSAMDHAWANSNVGTKNNHDPARGFLYPLINYGRITDRYYEQGNMRFDELYPAVYVKTLLDKMVAPYKLAGSFINSAVYPKLILPFTNKYFQYRESYRAQYDAKVRLSYDFDMPEVSGSATTTTIPFDVVENDPSSLFQPSGTFPNSFIVPIAGNYEVKANITVSTLITSDATTEVILSVSNLSTTTDWGRVELQSGEFQKVEINTTVLNLKAGDAITLVVFPPPSSTDNYVIAGSTWEVKLQNVVFPGGQVHLDANLPDMTQDELLVDLMNLFNLVIQTNAITKTVRLDFQKAILSNPATDWSKKIDWTSNPKTSFALENYAQSNKIGYEENESTDSLGNPVQEIFELTANNQQLEAEKVLFTSKFTNTATRSAFRGNVTLPYIPLFNQIVLSYGIFKPGKTDYKLEDWVFQPDNGNYWVAQKDNPIEEFDPGDDANENWILVSQDKVFERLEAKPRIMMVATRDNVITVSEDYNAGSFYFLDTEATFTGLEAETLKTAYYAVTQKMLTRTRMLTMNARLTPMDIAGLDFMKPIKLDIPERENLAGLFYLNAVPGYQPNTSGSTEVELVRITGGLVGETAPAASGKLEYSDEYSDEYN